MSYEHLGLTRWPFPTVPKQDFCTFIADRAQLRSDVEQMLRAFTRQETSDIHLLWSWYGAGKTHTLYYLANRCAESKQSMGSRLYSMYSEFPKAPRSFVDIFRAFSLGLRMDEIIDAYLEVLTAPQATKLQRGLMDRSPDLATALHVITSGTALDQHIALRWLRGEALPAAQFRAVGIQQKISTAEEASRVMASLVHLLSAAAKSQNRPGCRVVWLLDEFQRMEQIPARLRDEINVGLHSTFNACPEGLTLVFSFSGSPKTELPSYFTSEMRDRIGLTKVLVLPPLQPEEALVFMKELLHNLRTVDAFDFPTFFPFTEDTCRYVIGEVKSRMDLKPRTLMQAFDAILQVADPLIQHGELDTVNIDFAKRILAEHVSLTVPEEMG